MVPICDASGNVSGIYGRKIGRALRAGTELHLYLGSTREQMWNAEAMTHDRTIILCEGVMDALTFCAAGMPNSVAVFGPTAFTCAHLEQMRLARVERVYIAFDRDHDGDLGADQVAAMLDPHGIEVHRMLFPRGMGANEYARRAGCPEQALRAVVQNAQWIDASGSEIPRATSIPVIDLEERGLTGAEESGGGFLRGIERAGRRWRANRGRSYRPQARGCRKGANRLGRHHQRNVRAHRALPHQGHG